MGTKNPDQQKYTTDPDIRIIHRPHQRSTRLLHKYKYNQQLKKVAVDVNADEKRPIVGERSSGADGTGGTKLWAPQTPQGKIDYVSEVMTKAISDTEKKNKRNGASTSKSTATTSSRSRGGDTTDPDIRIIHRPHQRSTRLLHKYKYNQQLKKVAVDVNADEKRPIVGERSSGADGTGGVKLWAPQTPQGKIVVFECGSSGTEETNSS
ncbi:hypothetical protein GPALN_004063 [Globodera pallida]|nr:hypothetical protein GPALN_004063 [Globodera pallida]